METQTLKNDKTFNIDTAHSSIGFAVKHMMFSKVRGQFKDYQASVALKDDNFEHAQLKFSADVNSVTTNNEDRDKHLKSADFFNTDTNKKFSFESTGIEKKGDQEYIVTGNMTMNGQTHPVTLNAEYSGIMKDPWGNDRIALVIKGKLNRHDWNMTYNAALETGGLLVGKEVELEVESQFI